MQDTLQKQMQKAEARARKQGQKHALTVGFAEAAARGNIKRVSSLLNNPDINPYDAIGKAVENGHIEIVRLLLTDSRIDPSTNNCMTIQKAAKSGHIEIVKLLLADPRIKRNLENLNVIMRGLKHPQDKKSYATLAYARFGLFYHANKLSKDKGNIKNIPKDVLKLIIENAIEVVLQSKL